MSAAAKRHGAAILAATSGLLFSFGVAAAGPRRPIAPHAGKPIAVRCQILPAKRTAPKFRLRLFNGHKRQLRLLVGNGTPAVRHVGIERHVHRLSANFGCMLDYVHRCFHAQQLALPPRASRVIALVKSAQPALLKVLASRRPVPCVYLTLAPGAPPRR